MDRQPDRAVIAGEDGFIVEVETVAPQLGLSPEKFWRELKRGIIYGVVERGEGEDAGRTRLNLRYRARSWSMVVEHQGAAAPPIDATSPGR